MFFRIFYLSRTILLLKNWPSYVCCCCTYVRTQRTRVTDGRVENTALAACEYERRERTKSAGRCVVQKPVESAAEWCRGWSNTNFGSATLVRTPLILGLAQKMMWGRVCTTRRTQSVAFLFFGQTSSQNFVTPNFLECSRVFSLIFLSILLFSFSFSSLSILQFAAVFFCPFIDRLKEALDPLGSLAPKQGGSPGTNTPAPPRWVRAQRGGDLDRKIR